MEQTTIAVTDEGDIVQARQEARQTASALGLTMMDQSRVATAVSELTRNVIRYAGSGQVTIRSVKNDEGKQGIEILVEDQGPGIADVERAMEPGYTTGKGLGLGLSGTRRLMDEMTIESHPGSGTRVLIRKWRV